MPFRTMRGMALPLVALVLAAGGALWLATMPAPGTIGDAGFGEGRAALLAARLALIAHASAYPDAYGPLGAGPGYLVCPDTDTPLGRESRLPMARANEDFRGDGPNPPCGGGALVVGRLPRHASPDGRRRAFHHESSQRFVYGVSTGHVNNPPGGAVRDVPVDGSTDTDVVAVILDPGGATLSSALLVGARDPLELLRRARTLIAREAGADAARALPHALVTRGELGAAARRRVAAWFVDTATDVAGRRLRPGATAEEIANALPVVWPDARCPVVASDEASRWIVDDDGGGADGDDGDCTVPDTIENTPRERHWFVREGWFRDVVIRRHASCHEPASTACRLEVVRDAGEGADAIRLALVPTPRRVPSPGGARP